MLDRPKILVTGGAGFIGSHTVVRLYEEGYYPIIIDNYNNSDKNVIKNLISILGENTFSHYECDCNDTPAFDQVLINEPGIKGVIHFAAYKAVGESVSEPLKYYKNNLGSMITLMELMRKHKIENLVFSSSCTVYGQPDLLPVTENSSIQEAQSPYGNTKQIGEEIIRDVVNSGSFSIKAVLLRYFNPIGAHPSGLIGELPNGIPSNLVPFITQTAAGIRSQLTVYGNDYNTPDGSCIRDYIHVLDLADAHISAFKYIFSKNDSSFYDTFNVGLGKGATVLEVIETFEKTNNTKVSYQIGPRRSGDVEKIFADVTKANNVLLWKAKYSMSDALRDAWNWQLKLAERSN